MHARCWLAILLNQGPIESKLQRKTQRTALPFMSTATTGCSGNPENETDTVCICVGFSFLHEVALISEFP